MKGLLQRLADALRVPVDEVEAVLREDESRARETVRMQRRGFLGALGALAAASIVPKGWIEIGPTGFIPGQVVDLGPLTKYGVVMWPIVAFYMGGKVLAAYDER